MFNCLVKLSPLKAAAVLSAIGALLLPSPALASEVFLPIVQEQGWLGGCDLCHQQSVNATLPANKPFITTLQGVAAERGTRVNAQDQDSLRYALGFLTPEQDSDGDMLSDRDELTNGTDPNDPSCFEAGCFSPYQGVPPEFGCAVQRAPRPGPTSSFACAALLCSAAVVRVLRRPTFRGARRSEESLRSSRRWEHAAPGRSSVARCPVIGPS